MQRKYDVLRLTALASLALSTAAVAQQSTDQTNPPAETAAPPSATEETPAEPRKKAEEEIVVTGSRVRRKDLTTPAPVTVISREQMITSGRVSLGDFLQTLPEQGNAINTGVNNGGDGSTRVSLRGIGDARTLVLVNGRRMVPGGLGADPSVDLNSIPTAAIERIEVLKDGASAIYGSDAIAGVVNIITRRRYTGTELSAYSGVAGHGDGFTYDLAATSGTAGDNGSLLFSAGFFDQRKIMAGDRDFSKVQYFFDATGQSSGKIGEYTAGSSRTLGGRLRANGTGNAAWQALLNDPAYVLEWADIKAKTGNSNYLLHDSSLTTATPAVQSCVAAGGALADCQWRPMHTEGAVGYGGDNYNYAPENYLITPQRRIQLYATGDARVGSSSRVYFESSFVERRSSQNLAPEPLIIGATGVTVGGDLRNLAKISQFNFYNPFNKTFTLASRRLGEFGRRADDQDIDTFRVVGGLDGTLPEELGPVQGWFWDLSLNYGRSSASDIHRGSLVESRVNAAIGPSMRDPATGEIICVNTPGDPTTKLPGCVPLDLFHGYPTITPAMMNYLTYTGSQRGTNELTSVQANLNGELIKLMSERPVGLAVGYEYRRVAGSYTYDPIVNQHDSTNGGSDNTQGVYDAHEGYAELSMPIISGMPFVEDLEGSAAVRVFRYSNFGSDYTYKFGARYKPITDVTLRGTYSTAFRAPSIADLYRGHYDNFPIVSDPCADTSAASQETINRCIAAGPNVNNNGDSSVQLRSTNGGTPTLQPETAKTGTVGVVFEPSMVRGFSATVDYYNVKIEHAISTIGESTILAGCYVTGSNPSYCNLIDRDPASGTINNILNLVQNLGSEYVAGIDVALRYQFPTTDYGRFALTFDGTYLIHHNQRLADGTLVVGKNTFDLQQSSGQGGTNPAWKHLMGLRWGLGGFGLGGTWKYVSSFHECGDSSGDFSGSGLCYADSTYQRHVEAYYAFDFFGSYTFSSPAGRTTLGVGINNAFDKAPPRIYNTFASATDQYTYDQVGRFIYGRINHVF